MNPINRTVWLLRQDYVNRDGAHTAAQPEPRATLP